MSWLAVKTASEMTYIVSSGALNSTPTNQAVSDALLWYSCLFDHPRRRQCGLLLQTRSSGVVGPSTRPIATAAMVEQPGGFALHLESAMSIALNFLDWLRDFSTTFRRRRNFFLQFRLQILRWRVEIFSHFFPCCFYFFFEVHVNFFSMTTQFFIGTRVIVSRPCCRNAPLILQFFIRNMLPEFQCALLL